MALTPCPAQFSQQGLQPSQNTRMPDLQVGRKGMGKQVCPTVPAAPPTRAHPLCSEHGVALLELWEDMTCRRNAALLGEVSSGTGRPCACKLMLYVPAQQHLLS